MNHHTFFYRILSTFLIFIFILSPYHVLTAPNDAEMQNLQQEIKEKQDKVKAIEKSIQEYKQKVRDKQKEASSLSNQVSILDNRVTQVELDVVATKEKLETLQLEINALDLEIQTQGEDIGRQKKILASLLRHIDQQDRKSFLQIFAAYSTLSEFYNTVQYVRTMEREILESTIVVQRLKGELEKKKEQAKERVKAYEALGNQLTERQLDLEEQKFVKQDLLVKTKASEGQYQTLLGKLKQQYQAIEQEISSIEREVRRRLEAEHKLDILGEEGDLIGKLSWPTQSRYITAYFHDPDYPYRNVFEHSGIDIRAGQGTAVKAAASGYIATAKVCTLPSCYSNIVVIHAGGISTLYGHMSKVLVQPDQFVTRGDVIGYSGGIPGTVGAGPFVTGAHLHFEVRTNGIPVNALPYMVKDF